MPEPPDPTFFETPQAWREWLAENHAGEKELWVGFYKKQSGRPSITWPESVEQALCFGWIDGVRRSVGPDSYAIRFTPRRPTSTWSQVNLRTFAELQQKGLVADAGRAAYARRREEPGSGASSGERRAVRLAPEHEERFRADAAAWAFFTARPPSYRSAAISWVVSAKQAQTRERRLEQLIADSAAQRTIAPLTRR